MFLPLGLTPLKGRRPIPLAQPCNVTQWQYWVRPPPFNPLEEPSREKTVEEKMKGKNQKSKKN